MSVGVVAAVAAIFGVIVGSFFNVVVYWLLRKESLFYPGSWCSECGMLIKFYDNVPILGWLWLRGCCWACGAKISWCYLVVEVIVALLCVLCVLKFGADSDVWLLLVFVLLLILITLIDLEFMIILNLLTLIGVVVAIVFTVAFDSDYLVGHLIAGAAVGVFFLIVAIVYFVGMGMGDVKFVGMMGFVLGCAVVFVIFVALLFGTIVGVGVMVRYGVREGCKKGILFGFWLAAGSFVGLFFGDAIVDWYFDIFIS